MLTRQASTLLVTGLVTTLVAPAVWGETVNISTGDFIASEWFTMNLAGLSGVGLSTSESTGGNPGAYRRIELTVDALESAFQASLWTNSAFTPASTGAIQSAVMRFDFTRVATSLSSANQVVGGVALLQGGSLHVASAGVTALSAPSWTSSGPVDLLTRFPTVDWQSGSEIVFGFYNIVTALSASFTIAGGYDNFSLSLTYTPHSVSLPVSLPLLLSALGIAGMNARRCTTAA